MTVTVRALLAQGNDKLGQSICHFDMPAIATCPGRTELCSGVCYAVTGRFTFKYVKDRLGWCYEQSLRDDFATRMIAEIKRKGCLVIRLHCSGDFYDAEYAEKWLQVMRQCPKVRFYF